MFSQHHRNFYHSGYRSSSSISSSIMTLQNYGSSKARTKFLANIKTAKNKQAKRTETILWRAIFIYGILQIAANFSTENNSSHSLKLRVETPTIYTLKTVTESSLNEESPNDGCNKAKRQQLCSLITASASTVKKEAQQRVSLIKSTDQQRPLFSTSSLSSVIHSSLLQIFDKLAITTDKARRLISSLLGRPRILMAEAATQPQQSERGIVVLNSTNFNRELLQNRVPFPHIKLIEFYVAYCGFCSKFKSTYTSLAKEIYPWRNVIRPAWIDVSTNLAVAQSWRVDTVPTLRVYPPPRAQLASKIEKQLVKMTKSSQQNRNDDNYDQKSDENDTQDYLYNEYNAAKPSILSLEPATYLNNISQFKTVLLEYIDSYVRASSGNSSEGNYIPGTWPDLRPVGESSLSKLLANHPRQELFLMIQGPAHQSQSAAETNTALRVMLELSSTASWKAVRYVKASENKALVQDVISQLKKLSRHSENRVKEQVGVLEDFLLDKQSSSNHGNIVLIHTDDSLVKTDSSSFAFISATTGQDLLNSGLSTELGSGSNQRAKRSINHHDMRRRSASTPEIISAEDREVELLAKHISQTYTETKEDRKFTKAIKAIYRDISIELDESVQQPDELINKASETSTTTNLNPSQQQLSSPSAPIQIEQSRRANYNYGDDEDTGDDARDSTESIFSKLHNLLFNRGKSDLEPCESSGDYFDKIKAIRYILFNEVPRTSFADKSPSEQQDKLNTLLNLVSVIKSYFPMVDSSSIQFMDGVHTYILKQQSKLSSLNNQQSDDHLQRGFAFDTRAFKQELKRLESEDKRLPEVKEFKHCARGGYPCALWRLFHTLTAFEYKKLDQIRLIPSQQQQQQQQQQTSTDPRQPQQIAEVISNLSNVAPEPVTGNGGRTINSTSTMINSDSNLPSPGERLVSPPSTTTSLSLTIVGPSTSSSTNGNNNQKRVTEADLPAPVLLVMKDYVTNFFSCTECSKNFQLESADLSLEKIRHQEPAEFSILWLWELHNRVNKRLSVDPITNPPDNPKMWFPSYEQCSKCYKKPPSFLKDDTIAREGPAAIFYEPIEWNRQEILSYLTSEYTKQPMDYSSSNLFADHLPDDLFYILAASMCLLILILLIRCFTQYLERQRRHKATLLNGNSAHYSLEMQ